MRAARGNSTLDVRPRNGEWYQFLEQIDIWFLPTPTFGIDGFPRVSGMRQSSRISNSTVVAADWALALWFGNSWEQRSRVGIGLGAVLPPQQPI